MLRLRLLKRGMAVQDQQRMQFAVSQVGRPPQGSSIMHLRYKIYIGELCLDIIFYVKIKTEPKKIIIIN